MSKERLKQFKNSLDFLDDSADMSDYHRLIDTLENLYKDGELDWIHRYAREKTRRVEELEMKHENIGAIFSRQNMRDRIQVLERENKRYRSNITELVLFIETSDEELHRKLHKTHVVLDKLLEGES